MLVAVATSTILTAGFTMSAWADQDLAQQSQQSWAQHRQYWIKAKLARMAQRLEIRSSQQAAWQAFAKVIEEPVNPPIQKPDDRLDAAALARRHADFATAQAKRMVQIADATAKLQEILTPEQRLTLDQIAHEFRPHGHHRHHDRQEQHGSEEDHRPADQG